jgi:alpha-ribazole phosphatase
MTQSVRQLFLVRHAQPVVEVGICYGQLDLDVEEAAHLRLVKDVIATAPKDALLLSSPLKRCLQTARALGAQGFQMPLIDDRLAEMNFGHWEGQPWRAIDRAQIDAWAADVVNFKPPGGESVRDIAQRALDCMASLDFSNDVVMLTHAGIIQVLTRLLRKQPLANFSETKIEYGSITTLTRTVGSDGLASFSLNSL